MAIQVLSIVPNVPLMVQAISAASILLIAITAIRSAK